jgi:hypothetical protein
VEPGEAGYSEAEAAQAAAAVPAGAFVMPGLPEEGAGGDEEDDDEIPFEDFDTMKIPRVSSASADSADDDSAYRDKDDSEDDETAAAEARSEDSD